MTKILYCKFKSKRKINSEILIPTGQNYYMFTQEMTDVESFFKKYQISLMQGYLYIKILNNIKHNMHLKTG